MYRGLLNSSHLLSYLIPKQSYYIGTIVITTIHLWTIKVKLKRSIISGSEPETKYGFWLPIWPPQSLR